MNPDLNKLQPYPFQKLAKLREGITPPKDKSAIALSIGEPKHPTPHLISEAMLSHLHGLANYPVTKGDSELREAIARWLEKRFNLGHQNVDHDTQVLPVNGTREALFAFVQAVVDRSKNPSVMIPNPFYQIYEGAAILAGATTHLLNTVSETGFIPDFDAISKDQWQKCQLLFLCTPGNPTGAVIPSATLQKLIKLAHKHDFVIASDECYSELYFDNKPTGLLEASIASGNQDYQRCIVFHSLSKRSNAPGMRSGFVAGDADILSKFLLYRTYHGCAMSPPVQSASIAAWNDEKHVEHNRQLYREKFSAVLEILQPVMNVQRPDASFYLWPETPVDDEKFTLDLFQQENIAVLPGSYLSRIAPDGINPGKNRVRMALVAPLDECIDAANRIRAVIERY